MRTAGRAAPALALALAAALALSACSGSPEDRPLERRAPEPLASPSESARELLGIEPEDFLVHEGALVKAFVIGSRQAPRRILFVHGWAGSGAEYIELATRLASGRDDVLCVCLDLPGAGLSDKPSDAPYDVPYFRRLIHAAVSAALGDTGSSQGVLLIGHSLGGHFCADYAANDGFGLAGLGLIAPAGWPGEVGFIRAWASKNDLALESIPQVITEDSYVASHRLLMFATGSSYSDRAPRYAGRAIATDEGRRALAAITKNAIETKYIDEALARIPVPAFLVWGTRDAVLPYEYSKRFLSRLPPGSVFRSFEGCGHTPHCERIPELASLIEDFMQRAFP